MNKVKLNLKKTFLLFLVALNFLLLQPSCVFAADLSIHETTAVTEFAEVEKKFVTFWGGNAYPKPEDIPSTIYYSQYVGTELWKGTLYRVSYKLVTGGKYVGCYEGFIYKP